MTKGIMPLETATGMSGERFHAMAVQTRYVQCKNAESYQIADRHFECIYLGLLINMSTEAKAMATPMVVAMANDFDFGLTSFDFGLDSGF